MLPVLPCDVVSIAQNLSAKPIDQEVTVCETPAKQTWNEERTNHMSPQTPDASPNGPFRFRHHIARDASEIFEHLAC